MMQRLYGVVFLSGVAGLLLFAFANNYLIFTGFGIKQQSAYDLVHRAVSKRKISLFTVCDNNWQEEEVEVLWPYESEAQIQQIVTAWLAHNAEEKEVHCPLAVQSVLIANTALYISFDQSPFQKKDSLFEKLMWVEALLKTLREAGTKAPALYLLVDHSFINDPHIDCTRPWPLAGFLPD